MIYQQIEKNRAVILVYCTSKSLIVFRRYHPFTYGAANHCCLSHRWQLFP